MSVRHDPWPNGVPCWVDLMASDVGRAGRFYSAVLGWGVQDTAEEHGGYVIAHVNGSTAAGIGPMRSGARSAWTLYFAHDDADAGAGAITDAGGTVGDDPFDTPFGRMAGLVDPDGAAFWVAQTSDDIAPDRWS